MRSATGWTAPALILLASCTGSGSRGERAPPEVPVERSIEEIQDAFTPEWMALPGVVGTGIGLCDGRPCIKVFVAGPAGSLEGRIPSAVEGYAVELERTDRFQARDTGSSAGPDQGR